MGDMGKNRRGSYLSRAIGGSLAVMLLLALVLTALGGEDLEATRLALPLAKIDGKPLTIYYFEAAVAQGVRTEKLDPVAKKALASERGRLAFLNELITERLQAEEAIRRGFDRHEEVQALLKTRLALMMEIFIGTGVDDVAPTDEALRRYYDTHLQLYSKPEMVRARHMLFENRAKAEQALQRWLAKKPSVDELRGRDRQSGQAGFDMGFFPRPGERREGDPDTLPQLAEAAFTLEKDGDIFPKSIRSAHGYHILMRTGHRSAEHLSFEEAKRRGLASSLTGTLRQKRVDATLETLPKRYPVVVYEENLNEVVVTP